jgi:hypothetical protein
MNATAVNTTLAGAEALPYLKTIPYNILENKKLRTYAGIYDWVLPA